jgi:hypothetical protein
MLSGKFAWLPCWMASRWKTRHRLLTCRISACATGTAEWFFARGWEYIFVELIKFVKTEGELETDLDRWLYVLKNMSRMKKIPVYLRKSIFEFCD